MKGYKSFALCRKNTHIATLVKRNSSFVMPIMLAAKDTENVVDALIREIKAVPQES